MRPASSDRITSIGKGGPRCGSGWKECMGMTKILERIEGHYEVDEGPFSRAYVWHPEHITVECDCGERFTLTATSTTGTCQCGTDLGAIVHDIQEQEARLLDKSIHPWHHDTQEQEKQHR